MKKPLRRWLAGLTIATAAATGSLTATGTATAAETSQTSVTATATNPGTSATEDDTAWGVPPIIGTIVHPLDTAWG